jgi:hypothetical protein
VLRIATENKLSSEVRTLQNYSKAVTPPAAADLSTQVRNAAFYVAKSNILQRPDAGPVIKSIAQTEDVTTDKVIRETLAGSHPEIQAAVEEEMAKAISAAQDSVATVDLAEIEKQRELTEVLKAELESIREERRIGELAGADGIAAHYAAGRAWDEIRNLAG